MNQTGNYFGIPEPRSDRIPVETFRSLIMNAETPYEFDPYIFSLQRTPGGGVFVTILEGLTDTPDRSKCAFGWKINNPASTVTIYAGSLIRATIVTHMVSNVTVNITGGTEVNPHYVYVEATGNTINVPTTALSQYPTPDDQSWRFPIISVEKSYGIVRLVKEHYKGGDIHIPSTMA